MFTTLTAPLFEVSDGSSASLIHYKFSNADKENGLFGDPSKVKYIDHIGAWFKSRGPLTTPRSPQGRPVIMQAGASKKGKAFAARWGELIFTLQYSAEHMKAFYQELKSLVDQQGRSPDECKILPAVQPIIGETEAIALEKQAFINELVNPLAGLSTLSSHLNHDFSSYALNEPVSRIDVQGARGSLDVVLQATKAEDLTLGEVGKRFGTSELTPQLVGTARQIADQLEALFLDQACDGFMLTPIYLPGAYEEFTRAVVPELQRRGLFRTEYRGKTLRENLGLI